MYCLSCYALAVKCMNCGVRLMRHRSKVVYERDSSQSDAGDTSDDEQVQLPEKVK